MPSESCLVFLAKLLRLGASGSASIAPDNLGFGSSADKFKGWVLIQEYTFSLLVLNFKSKNDSYINVLKCIFCRYILNKQYQTSAMPLWLKSRRLVAANTTCGSEISDDGTDMNCQSKFSCSRISYNTFSRVLCLSVVVAGYSEVRERVWCVPCEYPWRKCISQSALCNWPLTREDMALSL